MPLGHRFRSMSPKTLAASRTMPTQKAMCCSRGRQVSFNEFLKIAPAKYLRQLLRFLPAQFFQNLLTFPHIKTSTIIRHVDHFIFLIGKLNAAHRPRVVGSPGIPIVKRHVSRRFLQKRNLEILDVIQLCKPPSLMTRHIPHLRLRPAATILSHKTFLLAIDKNPRRERMSRLKTLHIRRIHLAPSMNKSHRLRLPRAPAALRESNASNNSS